MVGHQILDLANRGSSPLLVAELIPAGRMAEPPGFEPGVSTFKSWAGSKVLGLSPSG